MNISKQRRLVRMAIKRGLRTERLAWLLSVTEDYAQKLIDKEHLMLQRDKYK